VIASPAFIVSGFTWPTSAMPQFVQYFNSIIPLTPYLEALKIMVVERGSDYLTQKYFIHLLILALVYFVLGWVALKIKINSLYKKYQLSEDDESDDFDEITASENNLNENGSTPQEI
jgi:ABC-2 type transport system permease protein